MKIRGMFYPCCVCYLVYKDGTIFSTFCVLWHCVIFVTHPVKNRNLGMSFCPFDSGLTLGLALTNVMW